MFVFQDVSWAFVFFFYYVTEYAGFVFYVVFFAGFHFFLDGFWDERCGYDLAVCVAERGACF